jgi:hypothetical protein
MQLVPATALNTGTAMKGMSKMARCGKPIKDLFYIKPRPNGLWAIGFANCP